MTDRSSGHPAAAEVMRVMDPEDLIDTSMEWVRFRFRGLVFSLALAGYGHARVITARRTFEEQVQLYGHGRSADELAVIGVSRQYAMPGSQRVSWIDPRYSRHVKGLAIDLDLSDYGTETLGPVDEVTHQLGITWGGVWSVRDYSHFEV